MKIKFVKDSMIKVCSDWAKEDLLADGWKIEGDESKEASEEPKKKGKK